MLQEELWTDFSLMLVNLFWKTTVFLEKLTGLLHHWEEFIPELTRLFLNLTNIQLPVSYMYVHIQINSPKLFSAMDEYSSYVSLQPPPERMASDKVQFESLDLYMWTGPEFRTPTVLFYFGPICSVGNTGSYDSEVSNTLNF